MIVIFIVIANEVMQCLGARFCDSMNAVDFVRMWEIGTVEVMFEGVLGGTALKVYRKVKDKIQTEDRSDRKVE